MRTAEYEMVGNRSSIHIDDFNILYKNTNAISANNFVIYIDDIKKIDKNIIYENCSFYINAVMSDFVIDMKINGTLFVLFFVDNIDVRQYNLKSFFSRNKFVSFIVKEIELGNLSGLYTPKISIKSSDFNLSILSDFKLYGGEDTNSVRNIIIYGKNVSIEHEEKYNIRKGK